MPESTYPNPLDPIAWAQAFFNFAPQALRQDINSGWIFGPVFQLTNTNSSAPSTEVEVLKHHSYGRQLGRISDALAALVEATGVEVEKGGAIAKFEAMKAEIDEVKVDKAVDRVEQLRGDLALLKCQRPEEYRRLAASLRDVLAREA